MTAIFLILLIYSIKQYLSKNYTSSILIVFFFLTGGFQIVPTSFFETNIGINKPFDYAILFIIITSLVEYKENIRIVKEINIVKLLTLFLSFIVILIIYNILIYDYSMFDVLKPSRKIFLLLLLFNLIKVDTENIENIFNFLFVITIIQSFIFLLQIPLNNVLLNNGVFESIPNLETIDTLWIRYYNTPNLLFIFLYYSFLNLFSENKKSWPKFLILLMTTIAPLHRSLIFAVFFVFFILNFISKFDKFKYNRSIAIILLLLILTIPQFLERLSTGISESIYSFADDTQMEAPDNNLAFRLAHLYERADFIFENPKTMLLGIGFLPEDSPQTKALNFAIGYVTDENEVTQIDTADIAWSLIIVYTGLIGVLFYCYFYFKIMQFFWRKRMNNIFSKTGLAVLLTLFFTSFTSSSFFDYIAFYQIPLLIVLSIKFDK